MDELRRLLESLHSEVARKLLTALQQESPDPRMVAEAIKFLKNNDISVESKPGDDLHGIADMLPVDENTGKLRLHA